MSRYGKATEGRVPSADGRVPGLTEDLVAELLEPAHVGRLPDARHCGKDNQLRRVSTVAVIAPGSEPHLHPQSLAFDIVDFLAAKDWLVSFWHESPLDPEQRELQERRYLLRNRVQERTLSLWKEAGPYATAGDLGILALRETALHYSVPRKRLNHRVRAWEQRFYKEIQCGEDVAEGKLDLPHLTKVARIVADFHQRLSALNLPRQSVAEGWFDHVSDLARAEQADEIVNRSLSDLGELGDRIRIAARWAAASRSARVLAALTPFSISRLIRSQSVLTCASMRAIWVGVRCGRACSRPS